MKYNCIKGNGIELSVQHFPDRKRPCLCVEHVNYGGIIVLGSFNSEENAELFMDSIAKMTGTYRPDAIAVEVVE